MGWFFEDALDHEGYAVGFVELDSHPGSSLLRELTLDDTDWARTQPDGKIRLKAISAGCDCGWRSPRWRPDPGTVWVPSCVVSSSADDEKAWRLWTEHVSAHRAAHAGSQG